MDEFEKFFNSFSKLGLDEKRNAFNEEIIKISYLLKEYLKRYNHDIIEEPYNYKKGIDNNMSESELLDLNYKNIYSIKHKLLLLISLIESRGLNNGNKWIC